MVGGGVRGEGAAEKQPRLVVLSVTSAFCESFNKQNLPTQISINTHSQCESINETSCTFLSEEFLKYSQTKVRFLELCNI